MLVGRIVIGRMLDMLNPLLVATSALAIPAVGCAILLGEAPSVATFAIAAALFGFSAGAEVDILPFMVARDFWPPVLRRDLRNACRFLCSPHPSILQKT